MEDGTATGGPTLEPHPIQLIHVGVRELTIKSRAIPDFQIGANVEDARLLTGFSRLNDETGTMDVGVGVEVGFGEEMHDAPYEMKIMLNGRFEIDTERFSVQDLPHWATHNAPLILFPMLREHIYGLTLRCGFKPLLLPLMTLPPMGGGNPDPGPEED